MMTVTKPDINITNSSFYRVGLGIGKWKPVDIARQKEYVELNDITLFSFWLQFQYMYIILFNHLKNVHVFIVQNIRY